MGMGHITHIVVHYSATFPDQEHTVEDIRQMHLARGWRDIGYHYYITRDGVRHKGRPETMVGAHVGGQNSGKIGVCWEGGVDRATGPNKGVDNRTRAQTRQLIQTIRELLHRYPGAKIVGHRDLAATQCPGFDVPAWWAGINGDYMPSMPVNPEAPVVTPGVDEDRVHTVEAGETWWSIAQDYDITVDDLLHRNGKSRGDTLYVGDVLILDAETDRPTGKSNTIASLLSHLFAWIFGGSK